MFLGQITQHTFFHLQPSSENWVNLLASSPYVSLQSNLSLSHFFIRRRFPSFLLFIFSNFNMRRLPAAHVKNGRYLWWDSTDGKAADCGVEGFRFKSWQGMDFATYNWNFILRQIDSAELGLSCASLAHAILQRTTINRVYIMGID